jgi:hypothetical protein
MWEHRYWSNVHAAESCAIALWADDRRLRSKHGYYNLGACATNLVLGGYQSTSTHRALGW